MDPGYTPTVKSNWSHGTYTVVSGSAAASSLQLRDGIHGDASSLAVLSARPDGPKLNMLSLILVARTDSAKALGQSRELLARKYSHQQPSAGSGMGASAKIDGHTLLCMWHTEFGVYNASLFRLVCHSDDWVASTAMHTARQRVQLVIALPNFAAQFAFRTEALSRFPESGITGCVDFAYNGGDRPRDFNEWATAQRLVGVDRVYVADQLHYRHQVRDQIRRGFAVFTHDYPHRYVTSGGRTAPQTPTTYNMFYVTTSAYNLLCLHEHWYDDWVFVSYSTDEYFVLRDVAPPKQSQRLIGEVINRFWELYKAPRERRMGGWTRRVQQQLCTSMLCVYRPFYGPSHLVNGESLAWTNPWDSTRLRYGSDDQLSIERFTQRFKVLPPKGSVRKCFVHPDWRLGSRVKVHGFAMQACPLRDGVPGCKKAWPGLRTACLELCGEWGNESFTRETSCKGFKPDGMLVKGLELAHFRVAPVENR